jgi:multiple sugar transport system substrate-binding protein
LSGSITVAYADELGKKPPYVVKAAAAVQQAHPDATVNIVHEQVNSGAFYTSMLQALASGDAPDVLHVAGDRTGELADLGYISALDGYLANWPDWQYYSPPVRAGVTYRGKVWALPYGLDTRFLYYRRDIFRQAGLSADWQPQNVGDILTAAATIKEKVSGVMPYALYAGQAGDSGTATHAFVPLLYAYGGALQDRAGYWIGNSAAIRKALAYYAKAYGSGLVPQELLTMQRPWPVMRERLGEGKLALLFEGGWVYGGWQSKDRAGTEKNIGYLLHPTEEGGPGFTIGGPGTCWYISAASAHKDLAWEFIATFNSQETVGLLNYEDPHPVARVDSVRVPEYRAEKFLVDSTESLRRAHFMAPDAAYPKVVSAIHKATARVATGEAGPEEAASRYAEDLRQSVGPDRVITLT